MASGGSGLRTDPQRKEQKWGVIGCREEGRRKMNGVGGGVDCGRIRTEKSKNERCCNAVGARGQRMENTDAPGVGGELGERRASGRRRDFAGRTFFLLMHRSQQNPNC